MLLVAVATVAVVIVVSVAFIVVVAVAVAVAFVVGVGGVVIPPFVNCHKLALSNGKARGHPILDDHPPPL